MLFDYYSDRSVRARLVEFLGGSSLDDASAVFITSDNHGARVWYNPRPVSELWQILAQGLEVARSLWDRKSLLAHLDIEYVNFDDPAEPYLEPNRAFRLQRPVVETVQEFLLEHGIAPLHLLSGRGHHFLWRVDRESTAIASLGHLGRVPDSLAAKYRQPQPPAGEIVEPDLGAAFAGLGLVLEFVAHHVLDVAGGLAEIPIELTAVETAPGQRGREVISVDLSEYGDPLSLRSARMPFSAYLKPQHYRTAWGDVVVESLPPLLMIPLHEMNEQEGLLAMRDVGQVLELARRASVQIPEQSRGMEDLIASYRGSALASFHDRFYRDEHDPPEVWPQTYDRTPLDPLPACTRRLLEQPNDWLLKPAGIQLLVRVLLSMGWSPRHIAGLIRSKYERDHGWGATWYQYDAATRADFYVRLFAGLIATGRDRLGEFHCLATREKGYCCDANCGALLESYRNRLLAMRERCDSPLFLWERRFAPPADPAEELANQSERIAQER